MHLLVAKPSCHPQPIFCFRLDPIFPFVFCCFSGVKKQFSYSRRTACRACGGKGASRIQRCPDCGGSGMSASHHDLEPVDLPSIFLLLLFFTTCDVGRLPVLAVTERRMGNSIYRMQQTCSTCRGQVCDLQHLKCI